MQSRLLPIVIPALLALLFSCSGPYLKNRSRDLADILTIQVRTKSYGASLRAGPIKVGLQYEDPEGSVIGLRGGAVDDYFESTFALIIFGADYIQETPIDFESNNAKKGDPAIPTTSNRQWRHKLYHARSPFGTQGNLLKRRSLLKGSKKGNLDAGSSDFFAPVSYFTDIQFSAGLYFGFRLGINPGELLDFLLGWSTLDFMSDDGPYDPALQELKQNPAYRYLDEPTKQKMLEELRRRNGNPESEEDVPPATMDDETKMKEESSDTPHEIAPPDNRAENEHPPSEK